MFKEGHYDLKNLCYVEEIKRGYLTEEEAKQLILQNLGFSFIDYGHNSILIGKTPKKSALVKVCTNLGISNKEYLSDELAKIECLNELSYKPDIIFDHTRKNITKKPMWKYMVENYDGIVAVAPVIVSFDEEKGLDKNAFLEDIEEMASEGVKLMLFHPTAVNEIWEFAKERIAPTTSWSGGLLRRDMMINKRDIPIVTEYFDDILAILKKYNVTCDIGTVYRPSRISEALDKAHHMEIILQEKFIQRVKNAGVFCIREGCGHISLAKIKEFCMLLDKSTPLMPLPVSTDAAIGFDHVACAVASTLMGYYTNMGIISPVTRVEHTGGIPSLEDVIEALKTARVVAHSLDLKNIPEVHIIDDTISSSRQRTKSCHVSGGLFNTSIDAESEICDRCDVHCPLRIIGKR